MHWLVGRLLCRLPGDICCSPLLAVLLDMMLGQLLLLLLPAGQKYHSVVLRPQQPVSDTCVFTAYRTADGR